VRRWPGWRRPRWTCSCVRLLAKCVISGKKRTAERADRNPSLLGSSPWPTNRVPRCALRSEHTPKRATGPRRAVSKIQSKLLMICIAIRAVYPTE
jgi:hypothetical protein